MPPGRLLGAIVRVLFLPSLLEELIWRGALLPRPEEFEKVEPQHIATTCLVSACYILHHYWPMANLLDNLPGPARQAGAYAVFRDIRFLVATFLLTVILVGLYIVDGSIWPCVFVHWVMVVTMQHGFGYFKILERGFGNEELHEALLDVC